MQNKSLKPKFIAKLGDESISLIWLTSHIVCPEHLKKELDVWRPTLDALTASLAEHNLADQDHPWLVSSAKTDIFGNVRGDSKAHSLALAIDVAPVYSLEHLTAEDRTNPHLATDILKLALISKIKLPVEFAVEGDHLHIIAEKSMGLSIVHAYPTYQKWYALGEAVPPSWKENVLRKLFIYDPAVTTLRPATDIEMGRFAAIFSVSDEESTTK